MMNSAPQCRKSVRWNCIFSLLIFPALILSACAAPEPPVTPTAAPVPTITPTADPCAPVALPGIVDQLDDLLREFEDTTYVANMTPQDSAWGDDPPSPGDPPAIGRYRTPSMYPEAPNSGC